MLDGRVRSLPTAFSKSPKRGPRDRKECPKFLAYLRTLPCVITHTRHNIHAAHIRFSDAASGKINPGIGKKPDDRHALPLCFELHTGDPRKSQHSMSERGFWQRYGVDPIATADKLWTIFNNEQLSQIEKLEAGEKVIREARS
jgi:hypothetical protein